MCGSVCTCPGCYRNHEPSVHYTLVELQSADGFVYPKLLSVPYGTREWRTAIAPPIKYVPSEELEPTVSMTLTERRYRWNGRTRRDLQAMTEIRIFEEVIETPPKPKYRVCESPIGKWCNACRTGHSSVAPRIVPGR